MNSLRTATRYEQLLGADVEPAPYEYALLFQADGWMARRRAKARFNLIRGIDARLRALLHEGERVYFATSGTTATAGEQFFSGAAIAQAINRRALVFTTERVLLVQIDSRRRPGDLLSQIAYAAILEVKSTWNGYCRLRLRDGSKLNFLNVPKADRQQLATLLGDLVKGGESGGPAARMAGLEHLCPHCFVPVPGHPEACPHCQGKFKLARVAALRSLLFPGLGDWYLGHRAFAAMEMFGMAILWFRLVVMPLAGIADEEGRMVVPDLGYWIFAGVFIAVAHGIDAVMTRSFALKGHHPAR